MRVFVTGATGFIGSAVVQELNKAGHHVLGLARSEAGAKALAAAGAQVHRGSLEDLDSLRIGAAKADGIIHLAFVHDFAKYLDNCETDRRAIEALSSVLVGSDRPFIVTSGTGVVAPGRLQPKKMRPLPASPRFLASHRKGSRCGSGHGVRVSVVRLPQIHDQQKQGLITYLINLAREKRVSAFVGDGTNRWPEAHLLHTALLYRLVLEKGSAGACYHAVAEEGVPIRDIAEVIGRRLNVPVVAKSPEEAANHLVGWECSLVSIARLERADARTAEMEPGWASVDLGS